VKVLHVITDTNIGGAGRYLLYLLPQPAFRDLDVAVACPDGELASRLEKAGIRRVSISGRDISFSPKLAAELVALMGREKPDLVHTHGSLSGRIAARLRRIPVVYTKHGLVRMSGQTGLPPTGPLARFVNKNAAKLLADRVIAVSEAVRKELEESGIPPSMITVIPNGIELRLYKPGARKSSEQQPAGPDKAGICSPIIGTLCRLSPEKGLDTLIDAAKLVITSCPSARFVIAGTGILEKELQKKILDLRLEPYVRMIGFVDDVPGFLGGLDVFVLPSNSEAIGLAVIEAMASGLPVVATRVGGVPEAVIDGITGLLVPPGQPKALAQAISRLIVDPDLAESMGAAGRKRAETMFDAEAAAERTVAVYTEVLISARSAAG
jgi:glycosyltransferase involved in cell wall biosynthesis